MAKRSIKAILQGADLVNRNPGWVEEKLAETWGYRGKAAQLLVKRLRYKGLQYGARVDKEAVAKFFKRYKLLPKGQKVNVTDLYTNKFLP